MEMNQVLFDLKSDMEPFYQEWSTLGWKIAPWPLTSETFVVSLPAIDGELYALQVTGDTYPMTAPHVIPIDPDTGRGDVRTAWPQCAGFRVESHDLCLPYTRTGYSLHPEWLRHPIWKWDGNDNIRITLESLFNRLNDPTHYKGRYRE